uniref:Uncharacterized protein n=1 Tax=Otus sunia TaxID=257818 RepID=A0A8C8ACH0_9STRI
MFDKASLKLGLDKAVLQSMSGREGNIAGIQQFSKKEIEDLLRKGAYAAIMEEDDEGSKFCEEDIDQILLRRTTTITIESEGKGSTFAKVPPRPLEVPTSGEHPRTSSPNSSPNSRPASWRRKIAPTSRWTIPIFGKNGLKRPIWTWICSTARLEKTTVGLRGFGERRGDV